MRKWLLFLLFFVWTTSFAQNVALWERQLESVDDINAIVTLSEERFILLGTKVSGDKDYFYLAELDIDGTLIWDTLYNHIEGFGGDMVLSTKGTLVIISGTNSDGIFLEVDITGEILNTRIHEGFLWWRPKIIEGIGGGFLVRGGWDNLDKIDDMGNIEWSLNYEYIPAEKLHADFIVGKDGRYHSIGEYGIIELDGGWSIPFSHINEQGFFEKIDTLKGLWDFSMYQDAYAMIQAENEDFIIVGRDGHWGYGPLFLRVNEVGHVLPSSNSIYTEELYDALLIEPLDTSYSYLFRDDRALEVYENSNGTFTLIGEATTEYEAVSNQVGIWIQYKKPFILQIDESGELLCFHTFLDETVEDFEVSTDNQHVISGTMYSCSSQLADGSIVMAAKTHTSNGNSEMHLFRFDVENLCATIEATDIEVENKNQPFIQVTPNPAHQQTTIHYQLPVQYSTVDLQLYDLQGVLVREWRLETVENKWVLDLEGLASGVYFYRLGEIGGKLVVE